MATVTLGVSSIEHMTEEVQAAFRGVPQGARIDFASIDLLWRVLTRKRWDLLATLAGQGGVTIREAARRVGRDVKAVHGDVTALLAAGVLERGEDGLVSFPYDAVRVDFTLTRAA